MAEKVYTVDNVDVAINKSDPPVLIVNATGTVRSGGWSNPQLSAYVYIVPPADGYQEFDFLADRPTGTAIQAILPIAADYEGGVPDWLKGVRIYAETNDVEQASPALD